MWVLDPGRAMLVVYRSLLSPRILAENDLLEGEDVVPGFRVAVGELFEI